MKLQTDPHLSLLPLPRFLQIEPVGQCNLRCRMCPISFRRDGPPWGPPAFMDPNLFKGLIDQFDGLEELHLQGLGEPFMHPAFFDLVRYAVKKGIKVSTNTNLTLLTSRRAKECVESGLDTLHASIDGATAETYEYIRRDGNFRKVIANLDRLMAARAAAGSATPHVRMVAVAMRRNLEELPAIVRLAREHGVDTVFVQHLCHDYREGTLPAHYHAMRDFIAAESLENEAPERLAGVFGAAQGLAAELGVDLRLPPLVRQGPRKPNPLGCDWPHRGAYLSYKGEAMPCCMVSTPDRMKLGDMAKESVVTVWNGRQYREFRAALASGQPPEICRGCGIYNGTF
ncbi:MAG: radical SAM/SPASM domain-containing protein [Candidatus Bathyarchaeota archaeon]